MLVTIFKKKDMVAEQSERKRLGEGKRDRGWEVIDVFNMLWEMLGQILSEEVTGDLWLHGTQALLWKK